MSNSPFNPFAAPPQPERQQSNAGSVNNNSNPFAVYQQQPQQQQQPSPFNPFASNSSNPFAQNPFTPSPKPQSPLFGSDPLTALANTSSSASAQQSQPQASPALPPRHHQQQHQQTNPFPSSVAEAPPPYVSPFSSPGHSPAQPPRNLPHQQQSSALSQSTNSELDEQFAVQLSLEEGGGDDDLQHSSSTRLFQSVVGSSSSNNNNNNKNGTASHQSQVQQDEAYARKIEESGSPTTPIRNGNPTSAGPSAGRGEKDFDGGNTSVAGLTLGAAAVGVSSADDSDAELARILQEEEDAAFAQDLVHQERIQQREIARRSTIANNNAYNANTASSLRSRHSVTGFPSPPKLAFRSSVTSMGRYSGGSSSSPGPATAASSPRRPSVLGKPGVVEGGFPAEPSSNGSRFSLGECRDLDVCFWGGQCVTVMEGDQTLLYVNLLGCFPLEGKWEVVMQRMDSQGENVYIIQENLKGKAFQIFDPQSVKAINCVRTKQGHLSFSTITNTEKLVWQDGDMRIQSSGGAGGGGGFLGLLTRKSSASQGVGSGITDPDLCAYVMKQEMQGELKRFRIRVGGRGMSRVDLVVGSWIGQVLLG